MGQATAGYETKPSTAERVGTEHGLAPSDTMHEARNELKRRSGKSQNTELDSVIGMMRMKKG